MPKKRRRKRVGTILRPLAPTARNSVLSRLMRAHAVPHYLRSDNGPEFVSKALLKWATEESLQIALIDPGKPWQNGTNKSFNGKFRDECLSMMYDHILA